MSGARPTDAQVLQALKTLVAYLAPAAPTPDREALTLEELASRYGTTARAARHLIATGRLPAAKTGRAYLVRVEDAARVFAPSLRSPSPKAAPANDSDEALAAKLRARGIRVAGGGR